MTSLSFSDFRKNMASSFDLVDAGEKVYINRGSRKTYAIIPVEDGDLTITPALAAKIEKARKEFREGKSLLCRWQVPILPLANRYFACSKTEVCRYRMVSMPVFWTVMPMLR